MTGAMCAIPVLYATTEGQTRRIAERLAATLDADGMRSRAIAVGSPEAHDIDWSAVKGVVLGASLHAGSHQRAATAFASANAAHLTALPSVFVSVSLSAASARQEERDAAAALARRFVDHAGWTPWRVSCVAGRLAYTQYSFLVRWLMKRKARQENGPTDTSRDHEFTDWTAVDDLAHALAAEVRRRAREPHRLSSTQTRSMA